MRKRRYLVELVTSESIDEVLGSETILQYKILDEGPAEVEEKGPDYGEADKPLGFVKLGEDPEEYFVERMAPLGYVMEKLGIERDGCNMVVNGIIVTEDYIPKDGERIVLVPELPKKH